MATASACYAQQLQEVRADSMPGETLAAKLTAADRACRGTCTISIGQPGRIDAAVALGSGHSVLFRAPVEIAAPVTLAGSQSVACVQGVSLNFTGKEARLQVLDGASDVMVRDCRASGSGQDMVVLSGRNDRVTVSGLSVSGFHIVLFACKPQARADGHGWDQHLCHDVRFLNNTIASATAAAVQYESVSGGEVAGNTIANASEGIYLNGGEADPNHGLYAFHSDGLSHIVVHGNTVHDIQNGCIWASVSTDIEIRENRVSHCGDVAIDFEGVTNGRSVHNTVSDAGRRGGALSTFFASSAISFTGDVVTSAPSPTSGPAIWIHNSTNDPAFTGPIQISGVTVRSSLPDAATVANFESLHGLTVEGSDFTNVRISMPLRYNGVRLANNQFRFTVPVAAEAAVAVGVSLYGGADVVSGNHFSSTVAQPAGTAALSMHFGDYNASEQFEVDGNDFTAAAHFAVDLRIDHRGTNPGVGSHWVLRGNRLNRPPEIHSNGIGSFKVEQPGS